MAQTWYGSQPWICEVPIEQIGNPATDARHHIGNIRCAVGVQAMVMTPYPQLPLGCKEMPGDGLLVLMFSKTSFFVWISKSSRSTVWQRLSVSSPFPCFSDSSAPCRGRLYQHFEKGQWEQVGRTGTILDAKAWPLFANMVQITSLHHTSSIPFIQLPSISISYSVLQIKIQAVEAWKEMDQSDQSLKSS